MHEAWTLRNQKKQGGDSRSTTLLFLMKSTMRRGYFLTTASKHQGQKKARCF